ncbi:MAG TPA: M28 family peptidase [Anaeromyxobacteraceae bacterium]|nr:M28 family peptidase [Anaeromyxobacteraceae bacterium]
MKPALLALLLAAAPSGGAGPGDLLAEAAPGLQAVSPSAISAGTRFLSSDLLEGRGTGTPGHEIAALWVATQMQAIGLEPAGADGRWEQPVPLRAWKVDPIASSLVIHGPGLPPVRLVRGQEFVSISDGEHAVVEMDGALAFAGYAITAPEYGYDDLKGVDLTGKIAVVLEGAPSSDRPGFFPPAPRADLARTREKLRRIAAKGAAGVILVHTPEMERSYAPWETYAAARAAEQFAWVEGAVPGEAVPGLPARVLVSWKGFERIAAAAGLPGGAQAILDEIAANRPRARDLPLKASIRTATEIRPAVSANVLGILKGSDPALARQTVVVTAHLDHLGVGEPVDGDAIYNGAADNAIGVAVLLEVARALAAMPRRPARSVLFAAVTGEEKGLVGSSYLALHVPPAAGLPVACLNVDGAPTVAPLATAVARGAEHSTLGAAVARAAGAMGIPVVPDPAPNAAVFVRSDQFSFVRQGVPSLYVTPGPDPAETPEERDRRRAASRGRYHSPRDEWDAAWLWEEAARLARLDFLVAWTVAGARERPAWNRGDFFERYVQAARQAPARPVLRQGVPVPAN